MSYMMELLSLTSAREGRNVFFCKVNDNRKKTSHGISRVTNMATNWCHQLFRVQNGAELDHD
jgi:hypothetical protein